MAASLSGQEPCWRWLPVHTTSEESHPEMLTFYTKLKPADQVHRIESLRKPNSNRGNICYKAIVSASSVRCFSEDTCSRNNRIVVRNHGSEPPPNPSALCYRHAAWKLQPQILEKVMAIPVFVLGLTCGLVISRLMRSH